MVCASMVLVLALAIYASLAIQGDSSLREIFAEVKSKQVVELRHNQVAELIGEPVIDDEFLDEHEIDYELMKGPTGELINKGLELRGGTKNKGISGG